MASEGETISQAAVEDENQADDEGSEGSKENEELENDEDQSVVGESSSEGTDSESESANEEESETPADEEGDEKDNSDNGSEDAGENGQEGSSGGDGQTESEGGSTLTEEQDGETNADALSGECGAEGGNLTWELSGDEEALTLTISGEGAMADYSEDAGAPWEKNAANIVSIILSDDVTSIGSYAFAGCSNIEEISVSESVAGIGDNAFLGCDSLARIYYAGTQEAWAEFGEDAVPDGVEVVYGKTTEIAVNGITLDQTEAEIIIGEQLKLTVIFDPTEATDKNVTWTSSNEEVATVDTEGNVTAIGIGTAVITATTLNGMTAQCAIEVKLPQFRINYVLNGGKNNQDNPEQYCETDEIVLQAPTRNGYIFDGWYLDAEFTQEATGIDAGQTGDKTFYAKWTGKTYKIVFNGNTANSGKMSKITYTMGKSTALPANTFTKKEYVFNGWNTRADGKGTGFKNKGTLDAFDAANGSTITLYAQWKIIQYTITYKLNGGTNNKLNPASYNFKSANISLAKPYRKGYVFQGWFTDARLTKAFTGIKKGSTGNRTVYAKWKIVKYTIQYVLNKGTAPKGNPTSYYVTTATLKLKNPTRKGYTFLGWYKEATYKTKVVSIPKGSAGNLKLYAKWTPTKYTIKYNLNGGTNNKSNPAFYTITTAKITLAKPTKKGYTFVGWYSDSKFKNIITVVNKGSVGNKTLFAKWKLNTYKIEYVLYGGKSPSANPGTFSINSAITFKNPQRTGYIFKGWFTDSSYQNKITGISKGSVGNKKIYAKWEPIRYTIQFSPNVPRKGFKYTGTMESIQCVYDQTCKLPANKFRNDDLDLQIFEWNTQPDGKGKVIKNRASVKNLSTQNGATVTLYAMWMEPADEVYIDCWLDTLYVPRGYTREIGYELWPEYSNERVTFVSSNTKAATISSSGVIKGLSNGKTTITAITSSGKKDTLAVKVVDNVRTWNPSYNYRDYDYGEPTVEPIKMYYSGNKLIFEVLVVNNRIFYAEKFDYINITLTDSNEKKIVSKKFTNIKLDINPYSTKKMKFVFDSARKADLIDGDYDYDYWYTYLY